VAPGTVGLEARALDLLAFPFAHDAAPTHELSGRPSWRDRRDRSGHAFILAWPRQPVAMPAVCTAPPQRVVARVRRGVTRFPFGPGPYLNGCLPGHAQPGRRCLPGHALARRHACPTRNVQSSPPDKRLEPRGRPRHWRR
jgi:hypothetical protein